MSNRTSTKISIPHPEEDCSLVGVLEQLQPDQPTKGRKITLIMHGTLGHKDYLFQKSLAVRAPIDSFRFDFRGNHESGGEWRQGNLAEDVVDIQVVVDYLKKTYGYVVDGLVGHSRGSIVGFRWLCTSPDAKNVSKFVNVSGRYRMAKIKETHSGPAWLAGIADKGVYEWQVVIARKVFNAKVTAKDLENFSTWDNTRVKSQFPHHIDVLNLHGLADTTVPVYDAILFDQDLKHRSPGRTNLCLVEDADHNFTGKKDQAADCIISWLASQHKGQLKTGTWAPGEKSASGTSTPVSRL